MFAMAQEDWEGHRLYYGRYICSVWNGDLEQPLHPHHLLSFEITFELEDRYCKTNRAVCRHHCSAIIYMLTWEGALQVW